MKSPASRANEHASSVRARRLSCAALVFVVLFSCLWPGCAAAGNDNVAQAILQYTSSRQYARLYRFLTAEAKEAITLDAFIERYDKVYNTIGLEALSCEYISSESLTEDTGLIHYTAHLTTAKLGPFTLEFTAPIRLENRQWRIEWTPGMILPGMEWEDAARLHLIAGQRGEIFDKNGNLLAANAMAETVYVDTALVTDFEALIRLLAPVIGETEQSIRKKLRGFVDTVDVSAFEDEEAPAPTQEPEATAQPGFWQRLFQKKDPEATPPPEEEEEGVRDRIVSIKAYKREDIDDSLRERLRAIQGVELDTTMLTPIRYYPYGRLFAHALGYTSIMTAEDLENPAYADYPSDALVGRSGLESAYEAQLHATPGYELVIVDAEGNRKETIARLASQDGMDLRLTIDINMQMAAELEFIQRLDGDYAGSVIVFDYNTGAIDAMASFPSYDPNMYTISMSREQEAELNDPKNNNPLFNRATQGTYPPGSTFKPFTAILGLDTGAITTNFEFTQTIVRNVWTPNDSRWTYPGIRRVMTTPGRLNLYNAMTYSDNIYFAYTAMQVGEEAFIEFCAKLGFGESMPFDLPVARSKIANTPTFGSLRLLADSGYGQGELLISPIQMASLFASLANEGNVLIPRLVDRVCETDGPSYETVEVKATEVWKTDLLPKDILETIQPMLRNVVANGTGKDVNVPGLGIAGKTGTAQIENGEREVAWFIGYTTEKYSRLVCVALEIPADDVSPRYIIAKELFTYAPPEGSEPE